MSKYRLTVSDKSYAELVRLSIDPSGHRFLRPIMESFKTIQGVKYVEMTRVEFCFLLLKLKEMKAPKDLCEELKKLAKDQDQLFEVSFERIKKDVDKYNLMPLT